MDTCERCGLPIAASMSDLSRYDEKCFRHIQTKANEDGCKWAIEKRTKLLAEPLVIVAIAAAREEGRAAGIEEAAKVAREMIDSAAHHAALAYKDDQEEEAELHEQAGNAAKTILRGIRALAPADKEKP